MLAIIISIGILLFTIYVFRNEGDKNKYVLYYAILNEVRDSLFSLNTLLTDERSISRSLITNKKHGAHELIEDLKEISESNLSLKNNIEKIYQELKSDKDRLKFTRLKQMEYEFNGLSTTLEYSKNDHLNLMNQCDELYNRTL